ncbi:hypothetical protein H7J88_21710 [Mycolicibacterium flavescens]|uniref:hypothetical protein n=1 Tax=Mycolicibacterium flavescens TaxID=1776 RepID=UPI00197C4C34|nr:hypothetical protein [Mycolicibacterium flavescens]MCV7282252.1 hypothetical protein [Mycolicibacterium flavescens]
MNLLSRSGSSTAIACISGRGSGASAAVPPGTPDQPGGDDFQHAGQSKFVTP